MNISDKQVEGALKYLAETDDSYGMLKGKVKGLEYRLKVTESVEFLKAEGTQEARKATARASNEYQVLTAELENTSIDYEVVAAKRKRAELVIEVWRTIQANQRRGNI